MLRMFVKILAIGLLMNLTAYGQSLGEIARENREKQAAAEASGAKPRVITNKDLPADPEGDSRPREAQPARIAAAFGAKPRVITNKDLPADPEGDSRPRETQSAPGIAASNKADDHPSDDHRSVEQRLPEQQAGDQWRRQILAQESRIADIQARIDRMNMSTRSVGGSAQYEAPYNRYGAQRQQRIAEMQKRLDEQKRKLDAMQEAARHAGMHTQVYDP